MSRRIIRRCRRRSGGGREIGKKLDEALGQLIVAELEEINALLDKLSSTVLADVLVLWSNRVHI